MAFAEIFTPGATDQAIDDCVKVKLVRGNRVLSLLVRGEAMGAENYLF